MKSRNDNKIKKGDYSPTQFYFLFFVINQVMALFLFFKNKNENAPINKTKDFSSFFGIGWKRREESFSEPRAGQIDVIVSAH